MRLRNLSFGILVVTISLLIGLFVTQLGRFPSNVGAITDVKVAEKQEAFAEDLDAYAPEERLLYIGQQPGCELRDNRRVSGTDYFCGAEITVFNLWEQRLSDDEFFEKALEELLAEREYSCVIVALGLNEAGESMERLRQGFGNLVGALIRTQPQARIVIQGVMDHDGINELLQELARQYHVEFMDVNVAEKAGIRRKTYGNYGAGSGKGAGAFAGS